MRVMREVAACQTSSRSRLAGLSPYEVEDDNTPTVGCRDQEVEKGLLT